MKRQMTQSTKRLIQTFQTCALQKQMFTGIPQNRCS